MSTFAVYGEWTGPLHPAGDYESAVHCQIVTVRTKRSRFWLDAVMGLGSIQFTDGTKLRLRVKDITGMRGHRRPTERRRYTTLIDDCVRHGVNRVRDLPEVRQ